MTGSEREAVTASSPVHAEWLPSSDAGFVQLATGPCPYLTADTHGKPLCSVYAVRPYNCRRYMCGREACDEPFDPAPVPGVVLDDRHLRRQYALNQRKSQKWANAHGWTPDA
jgi:Fe-S-cluster containining protein